MDDTFDPEINGRYYKAVKGFIIARNVRHTWNSGEAVMFISLVEPASRWGRDLWVLLSGREVCFIEELMAVEEIDSILPRGLDAMDETAVAQRVQAFFVKLAKKSPAVPRRKTDDRLGRVISYIDQNLSKNIELAEVANLAHLSSHRFRHLFTEQIGLPFTQYIIWQRLKKSIYAVASGEMTLGEAVENFGFTDQAHFSNTFKKTFGVFPRAFLQSSSIILQVCVKKE
ncbi:AraC-like DNA-binding protein [Dyadobacter sp. BE34]|uniref:AraC-like DNA-binding protein n=1 Tax=Dyadobacter fermentans TaxID=94254 RepID=A0ABU1QUG8_9BACT|nr:MULTISPECIES: AraC family transcriptional regulator [Dyadobacter]MDR6804795.1 AraC-like DNA-binding protein [Dyadobacter fermentans]MDR7043446.1 AraC-like DNA-binding protein [Dyadobacter sp. BE242]MDR7197758.1 AraC-like DNA-binding protein [Dyadobacter sp. BE34]MDR7214809.1 AraC-like DNA-binding protein [Dyadobacter sp. BE31]MDR7262344.1 AraC-like DNA-binding protein [Dyadobacter sp. BE32]